LIRSCCEAMRVENVRAVQAHSKKLFAEYTYRDVDEAVCEATLV
jgi:hypothetical protein